MTEVEATKSNYLTVRGSLTTTSSRYDEPCIVLVHVARRRLIIQFRMDNIMCDVDLCTNGEVDAHAQTLPWQYKGGVLIFMGRNGVLHSKENVIIRREEK